MEIFKIPSYKIEWLDKKMSQLQKAARKLGVEAPSYAKVGTSLKLLKDSRAVEMVEIVVSGAAPKIDGWEFLGTVEHTKAGNVLRLREGAKPEGLDLTPYYSGPQHCSHCGTKRPRKDTYLVLSEGGVAQVGRDCLKDFLGHASPLYYARLAELLFELEGSEREGDASHGEALISTEHFLAVCLRVMRRDEGYRTRGTHGDKSTASAAADYLFGTGKYHRAFVLEVDAFKKDDESSVVGASIEHAKSIEVKNDFENNLRVIAHKEFLATADHGLAAYVLQYHLAFQKKENERRLEREEAARALAAKTNEHVGSVGERLEFSEMTHVGSRSFDGDWGVTYYHSFEDAQGRLVVNKGTTGLRSLLSSLGVELDADGSVPVKVSFKATVTKQDEYKGRKQTTVNRLKITAVTDGKSS
jgi:hypothetical protein